LLTIALLSDFHINSKYCDYKSLYKAIKEVNEKADAVLVAGDVTDGRGVYVGQDYNLESLEINDMIEKTGNIMSMFNKPLYWIQGNHDFRLYKKYGVDISKFLNEWNYLGVYEGDTEIAGKHFRLLHPDGGVPYSKSYVPQKYLRNLNLKKENLNWLILGHLHTSYYFMVQGVHCVGVPSFQHITEYARRKGFGEEIGYWLIRFNKKRTKLEERLMN